MTTTLTGTPDPDDPDHPQKSHDTPDDVVSDGPAPETHVGRGNDVAVMQAKRARAVRLRLAGMTYDQIAEDLGYSDRSQARGLVMRSLARVESRAVEELREVQHARNEREHAALWPLIVGSHSKVYPPGHPQAGQLDPSYVDPETRIKAIHAAVRVAERDSRLMGLDHADGVAERVAQAQADEVRLVALALGNGLDAADLSDEQKSIVLEVVLAQLRAREAQEG
jgi:hypothetical protein